MQRALEQLDLTSSIHSNLYELAHFENKQVENIEEIVRISQKFEEIKTSIHNDSQVFEEVNTSLHNANKPTIEMIKTPVKVSKKPIPIMTQEKLKKLSEITETLKSVNIQLDQIFDKKATKEPSTPSRPSEYEFTATKYSGSSRYDYSPAMTVDEFYPQTSLLNNEFMSDFYNTQKTDFYQPQIAANSRSASEFAAPIAHKAAGVKRATSKKRKASRSKSKSKAADVQTSKPNKENSHMNIKSEYSSVQPAKFEGRFSY